MKEITVKIDDLEFLEGTVDIYEDGSISELVNAIAADGLIKPIIVTEGSKEGKYLIIKGKRLRNLGVSDFIFFNKKIFNSIKLFT